MLEFDRCEAGRVLVFKNTTVLWWNARARHDSRLPPASPASFGTLCAALSSPPKLLYPSLCLALYPAQQDVHAYPLRYE